MFVALTQQLEEPRRGSLIKLHVAEFIDSVIYRSRAKNLTETLRRARFWSGHCEHGTAMFYNHSAAVSRAKASYVRGEWPISAVKVSRSAGSAAKPRSRYPWNIMRMSKADQAGARSRSAA